MYCCDGLKYAVESAGDRGFAVTVEERSGGLAFIIKSRGVAYDDISKFRARLKAAEVEHKVNIVCTTGMRFCPWCGTRLEDVLRKASAAFQQLAGAHAKLRVDADETPMHK